MTDPTIDLATALTVEALRKEALRLGDATPGADFVRPGILARSPWHLERMRADVLAGRWRPRGLRHHAVWKRSGGMRRLASLSAEDRVLQGVLHRIAAPALDHRLDIRVHGWRRGRGCPSALRHLQAQTRTAPDLVVVQADIAQLYDTLPLDRVAAAVLPHGGPAWATLHRAWLSAWATVPGRGIPQGAPLSPLLANLTLAATFDRVLELARDQGRIDAWVRYGDDLLVAAHGPHAAVAAHAALDQAAAAAELRMHPGKTRICAGPGEWRVLGRTLRIETDARGAERIVLPPRAAAPARPRPRPTAAPPPAERLTGGFWARILPGAR